MNRIAFIHTAPWHAERFSRLAALKLPDWSSYAMVDESLLLDTIERGEVTPRTVQRLAGYIFAAADAGAAAVVVTCSSLGSAVDAMRAIAPVPLFRIDRGMAEAAVLQAQRIGVLASLPATLGPTTSLLAEAATAAGASCEITPFLCKGAFSKLMDGDKSGHDLAVRAGFAALAAQVELVVIAQASMADAIGQAAERPYLTSPELGMAHIARHLLRG